MLATMRPELTLAVCTRNRASCLDATIERLRALETPDDLRVEILIVDNGSTDNTPALVAEAASRDTRIRCAVEPRRGVSRARNAAVRAAKGDIIAFADDDVEPRRDWLVNLVAPIRSGEADAAVGSIRLPASRLRSWMEPWHRAWLGDTSATESSRAPELLGACMAFSRDVLRSVPAFDPELGAGALGQGEEALFSYQLRVAGYRIVRASDALLDHLPDEKHATRDGFLIDARNRGRSMAYMHYHWGHAEAPHARKRAALLGMVLLWERVARGMLWRTEGLPRWEMERVRAIAYLRQFAIEIRRPRNYDREGLLKLRGVMP
jgi:GT2 family glycosyltransferase